MPEPRSSSPSRTRARYCGSPITATCWRTAGWRSMDRRPSWRATSASSRRILERDTEMKMIDIHSHWGTKRGYTLRTPEELAQQKKTWNSEPKYATEAEMADYFRGSGVRVVLDFGFTKYMPLAEAKPVFDYGFETQRAHPDAIIGHWIHIDPHTGLAGVRELRRCIDIAPGFLGFAVSGSGSGPASDPAWSPFYELCIEAGLPVLIFVG